MSAIPPLDHPIIAAPMGGGPSTPALAAAVSDAGGLGFLAAAYKTADAVREEIATLRALTDRPFGVNVFVPGPEPADPDAVRAYVESLRPDAARLGTEPGEPHGGDDDWDAKIELLTQNPVPVVSFAFGCPSAETIAALRAAGSSVWVTVTSAEDARTSQAAGADALIVQGAEAGAHRSSFVDRDDEERLDLLPLLGQVAAAVDVPLVAAGGLATPEAVAAALAAGAAAVQVGTAFLLAPEAGTHPVYRAALGGDAPTTFTRAFTGRTARAIVNRFATEHGDDAPVAYPHIHYATVPIRTAARAENDPGAVNLWAGTAYALARHEPAGDIVRRLAGA
jgi:nitronate monooxygenase